MKSKRNIIFSLLFSILFSCETNIDYQKIKIDGKSGVIKILNNEYVFDSIIIWNGNKIFYSAKLKKSKKGVSTLNFNIDSIKNYNVVKSDFDKMCNEYYNNGLKSFDIVIRNKNYSGDVKLVKSKEIQLFNINKYPCQDIDTIINAVNRR
jgi:hypothetical protein